MMQKPRQSMRFMGFFFMDAQNVSLDSVIRNIIFMQIEPSQKSMRQPVGKQIIFVRQGIKSLSFEVDKKNNPAVIQFVKTFELTEPLNPRDSFFGGRTNGVRLHCEAREREEIRYADINSLYPYVNKNKAYPVGHRSHHGESGKSRYSQLLWNCQSQDSCPSQAVSSGTSIDD